MTDYQRQAIEESLVEASGSLISAILTAAGTPLEHELRSLKEDIFSMERRVRGEH